MRAKVGLLVSMAFSSLIHSWPAWTQPVAREFEVAPSAGAAAFSANRVGDFIVAWSEGDGWYARIYTGADAALGPPLPLPESSSEHPPWDVSSVALGPDRFVVGRGGWLESQLGTGSSARAFDSSGNPLGDDLAVGGFDAHLPTVKMDASGRFLITYGQTCWLGPAVCGPMEAVHSYRYDTFPGPGRYLFRVNDQTGVHVSMNASGAFLLSWISHTQPRAFVVRAVSHDDVPEPDRELVQSNDRPFLSGQSYLNDDGSFTAVWSTDQGLYGRHYSNSGQPVQPAFEFEDVPGRWVVPEAAGLILLGTQSSGALVARRYGFAGTPRGPGFQVNVESSGSNSFLGGAVLTQGAFVIIWQRGGAVFGRIFDVTTGVEPSRWGDVKSLYCR